MTVTFTCTDATAEIASCPAPVTVDTEGAGQTVRGMAVDAAGNAATATIVVNLHLTAPTIAATVTPTPSAADWYNSDVTVAFTCSDALSGIASCPGPTVVSSDGPGQLVHGTAVDKAGNTATVTTAVNVDKTALTITATVSGTRNAAGWYTTMPTIQYTCSDALCGVW